MAHRHRWSGCVFSLTLSADTHVAGTKLSSVRSLYFASRRCSFALDSGATAGRKTPLHGKTSDEFELAGTYLSVPTHVGSPSLVALCTKGKPDQLRLDTGVKLEIDSYAAFPVEKRLDGKLARASWHVFDTGEDLAIPARDFKQFLTGHKLIVGVATIWGTHAVIQFDLPNADRVAVACGFKL
jgi:hypothetical protein